MLILLPLACGPAPEDTDGRGRDRDADTGDPLPDGVLFRDDLDDGLGRWEVDAGGLDVHDAPPPAGVSSGCFTYDVSGERSPAWGGALWESEDAVSIACTIRLAERLDLTGTSGATLSLEWFHNLELDWGGVRYRLFDDAVGSEISESIPGLAEAGSGRVEVDLAGYAGTSAAFGFELRVGISLGSGIEVRGDPYWFGIDAIEVAETR
ncbi:MAG: hypothetical protein ACOZNI_13125 [Myxococcota bacterium]